MNWNRGEMIYVNKEEIAVGGNSSRGDGLNI
jgi:hypothetical protein